MSETFKIGRPSILEVCNQAIKEDETDKHQGRTEIMWFSFHLL